MLFYYSKVHQRAEDRRWRAAADVVDMAAGSTYATEFALDEIFDTEAEAEHALEQALKSKGYVEIYAPEKVAKVVGDFLRDHGFKVDELSPMISSELVAFLGTQGDTAINTDVLPDVPGWMRPVVNCHDAFGIVGCKIEYEKIRQSV